MLHSLERKLCPYYDGKSSENYIYYRSYKILIAIHLAIKTINETRKWI